MSTTIVIEENLETKKRKAATSETTKATITGYLPMKPKSPLSPPILKKGRYSNPTQETKDNDNKINCV